MQNIRKIIAWSAGAACYVALALALMAYDNARMHPAINAYMVDVFMKYCVNTITPPEALKGYIFVLNGNHTYTGPAIVNSGYFAAGTSEADLAFTPKAWIAHGGYSADIPEVPAALRHFYDPLGIDGGKTWLTDRGTNWEWIVNNNAFNPRINARDWALTHADNSWSFEKGKEWMRKALAEENEKMRDGYMARAWRCLGETLHLVADMGCPVHVRNDSHADVAGWEYRRALGDPDPYEVMVDSAFAGKFAYGTPDPSMKATCRSAETAFEIFNTLATFTNANFFTYETISGTGVKKYDPLIKGRPAYPSPKLEHLEYDQLDFTFYKTFPGGQRVKMCKDRSFLYFRGYPYIDIDCVESQASALIPNVMEAGANVIRLFIPKLKVTISEAKIDGIVKGTVSHAKTKEYTSSAVCRGPIRILVKNNIVGEGQLKSDGSFDLNGVTLKKDDEVVAEYEVGGIIVRSEPVKAGDAGLLDQLHACKVVCVNFSADKRFTNDKMRPGEVFGATYLVTDIGMQPIIWSGTSFTFALDVTIAGNTATWTITGTFSSDGRTLQALHVDDFENQGNGSFLKTSELRLKNLPLDPQYNYVPIGDFNYGKFYPGCETLLEFYSCHIDEYVYPQGRLISDYIETLWQSSDWIYVSFYK